MTNKYEANFNDFLSNYSELVNEYECLESIVPLEYCYDDVAEAYINLLKINKNLKFEQVLQDALNYAIQTNTNVIEGFSLVKSELWADQQNFNSTQQYFREINDIYNRHNNDYDIEYCPENREKLIEMNLKTVISIAKKYQGLGLTLNELISAGNLGLVIAWDKFDPNRSELKDNILKKVETLDDKFTYEELYEAVNEYMEYGDIKKKFQEKFTPNHNYEKKELLKWINANVYNAKFNSIATMWIRAYILIEIDNNSRVVKKPKTEIYKDKEKFGAYKKEMTMDIDAPISDSSDANFGDLLYLEDDTQTDMDISEAYDIFKSNLGLLLDGVKTRDRTIFLKKFGIGLPRPMLPKEIADQEGLSIARVSQIFQSVMDQMKLNQIKYDIDPDVLFDAVRRIQ